MVLAGDVGGTKTFLGLFVPDAARPRPSIVRKYATRDFESLHAIVQAFLDETGTRDVDAVCIGVAGQVRGSVARLVNVPWTADFSPVVRQLGDRPARFVNDLAAMATAIPFLDAPELAPLQSGVADPAGNAALIAAGTGLGEAFLLRVNGHVLAMASEGGHADFAARTPREHELAEDLARRHGRVATERVVSGRGIASLFRFTHRHADLSTCPAVVAGNVDTVKPEDVTASALQDRCAACVEALGLFVDAYGAEAGNLALRAVARAGVYL